MIPTRLARTCKLAQLWRLVGLEIRDEVSEDTVGEDAVPPSWNISIRTISAAYYEY